MNILCVTELPVIQLRKACAVIIIITIIIIIKKEHV